MQKKIYLLSSILILNNYIEASVINKTKKIIPISQKLTKNNSHNLEFENKFYYVWNTHRSIFKKKEAMWPFYVYARKTTFKENLQKNDSTFFKKLKINSNFENYGSINKRGIAVKRLMLRNFPTNKPIYYNPEKPGEGFPFSYNDNSSVHPNEPIHISHFSKDRRFAYVATSYAGGWVDINNIAYVSQKIINKIKFLNKIVLTEDNVSILNKDKFSLFSSKIGMVLPVLEEKSNYFKVLVISRKDFLTPKIEIVNIPKSIAIYLPQKLDEKLVKKNSKKMLNNPYGWGGSSEDRDCSSTIKDIYAASGKWVPRNSKAISAAGHNISIKHLNRRQKEAYIINHGIPYRTTLYMSGHIMLYIGHDKGIVKIFHNLWGVSYLKHGKLSKKIIGKTVESDLYIGKNLRKKRFLIDSIKEISIF